MIDAFRIRADGFSASRVLECLFRRWIPELLVNTAPAYLQAASTWRGPGFVVLKFWIGILSFALLVSFLGTAVEPLLLPLLPEGVLNVEVFGREVAQSFTTTPQRAVAVPAGVVLVFVALHVLTAFASANASIASSLLGLTGSNSGDKPTPDRSR